MLWNEDNNGVVALLRKNMETEARLPAQEESLTSKFRETVDRTQANSHTSSRVKTDLPCISSVVFKVLDIESWGQPKSK
ncbi:hypothetical protein LEMLEM_LOCUS3332 [Lemmus lemmus]